MELTGPLFGNSSKKFHLHLPILKKIHIQTSNQWMTHIAINIKNPPTNKINGIRSNNGVIYTPAVLGLAALPPLNNRKHCQNDEIL